jgi:GxxExxY protein
MTENDISFDIRGAIFDVYSGLGAGLLESVYVAALEWELVNKGYEVKRELALPVYYKDVKMNLGFRLDLLIENRVIIEVKSVEELSPLHHKQLLSL